MSSEIQSDLIFDLGMHRGLDTDFYLRKGFRVVALEANPELCAKCSEKFAEQIENGTLRIVEAALWEENGETISFFLNPEKDDWSSVEKSWAEKGGHSAKEIQVPSLTLEHLINDYGTPYYIKCDIEGADFLFTEQLKAQRILPKFVSVEATGANLLTNFRDAGYDVFQIVNQSFNGWVSPPNPPKEGNFFDVKFNGHMSGLFGMELSAKKWLEFDECLERYELFRKLKSKDDTLALGWLDFHAGFRSVLS